MGHPQVKMELPLHNVDEVDADVSDSEQSGQSLEFEPVMQSPNEMLVDPDEYVVDAAGEKDDEMVHELSNDSTDDVPTQPLANDCKLFWKDTNGVHPAY